MSDLQVDKASPVQAVNPVKSKLIFGIPVFNEEGNVVQLLTSIASFCSEKGRDYQVILVNDGSTDHTEDKILSHEAYLSQNVRLINQPENRGVAKAFDTLFQAVRHLEETWREGILITLEGDNTSDLKYLEEMLMYLEKEDSDVVLASCYAPGGRVLNTSWERVFLSKCANLFVKGLFWIFGVSHLHTFSSFYRCYRIPKLLKIIRHYENQWIISNGFECMVEILVKISARGAIISEVPITLDGSYRAGASKMKIGRTIKGYFRLLLLMLLPQKVVSFFIS